MDLLPYFKSVLEQDRASVVLCNTQHEIIYMNPASIFNYDKYGGATLTGKSLLNCHSAQSQKKIIEVVEWFMKSTDNNIVYTFHNSNENKDVYMVALRDDNLKLIGYYEKHEYRNSESCKKYSLD